MKSIVCLAFCCLLGLALNAQQVGINTSNPDPSAVLDVFSSDKGLLFPRLTTAQRNSINNPAHGLTIYNTTSQCMETYFPTGWSQMACACQTFPSASYTASPANPSTAQPVVFSPATTGASYAWQFQSGTPASSNAQNPSVTWSNTGTFQVILTITDANGCSTTDTTSITVSQCAPSGSQTFNYTGSAQSWTVPACVTSIQVDAYGAQGGSGNSGGAGGLGGRVQATLTVTPGEVLQINIGGAGASPAAGWNGGGAGVGTGAGGGGATDIRRNGTALSDRILVAGGGGGGAQGAGGAGGGLTGGQGSTNGNGVWAQGGTQSSGGAGGMYNNGSCSPGQAFAPSGVFGIGGNGLSNSACCCYGTGGGGGWYGGGGMQINGAGGGSSYVTSSGSSNVSHSQGVRFGNGTLSISW